MATQQQSTVESRLATLAFVVLVAFSVLGVGLWRVHRVSFVSVHSPVAKYLKPGDAVITKPVQPKQLQAGDPVSYYDPQNVSRILTQRLQTVDVQANTFTAGGSHGPLSTALLVGQVKYRLKGIGYALDAVRSRASLVLGVYVPAIIILGHELRLLADSYEVTRYRLFISQASRL